MSVSTLFNKNNFKIYVNEINLKNLNLSSEGNYKIKFPPIIPNGTVPLSVLAVDNIVNNVITLKWLEPSESLPFDTINCRILNAEEEVNCNGVISTHALDTRECIIRSDDGLGTNNLRTSNTSGNNLTYFLPQNYPSENGQVLSSTTNGIMSWTNKDINFEPRSYFIQLNDVTLISSNNTQDIYFTFNLQDADFYTAIFGARVVKINPTGSFRFRAYATNTGSTNIGLQPFICHSSNDWKSYDSVSFEGGINLCFWFQVRQTGNNTIRCVLESDISAGGECLIQTPSMFITKCRVN